MFFPDFCKTAITWENALGLVTFVQNINTFSCTGRVWRVFWNRAGKKHEMRIKEKSVPVWKQRNQIIFLAKRTNTLQDYPL